MRHIKKQSGDGQYQLKRSHANPPQDEEQAESRWGSYKYAGKLLDCLLEEQFFLCCYSEIRADLLGLGHHIEHVQPKSEYPLRTFDYQNLAACALDSNNDLADFKRRGAKNFGGHAKLGNYEPHLFISCHQPDCARFFAYSSTGRVVPARNLNAAEEARAVYTIKTLNLNSTYLIPLRRRWWRELEQLQEQHIANDWSIEHLAAVDLIPTNKKLSPFFSITRVIFGDVAEQILQEHAPHLA
jgi:uncharacterized protein (TIGR02646 family)